MQIIYVMKSREVMMERAMSGRFSPLPASRSVPAPRPPAPRSAPAPSFSATPAPRSASPYPIFSPLRLHAHGWNKGNPLPV